MTATKLQFNLERRREVIEQAHDDAESGKEDTDRRRQTAQVLNRTPDG
jgi:hypothetical protein